MSSKQGACQVKLKMRFRKVNLDKFELKPIDHAHYEIAIELMSELLPSAFMVNPNLAIVMILVSLNLNLRYGYTESMPTRLINYIGLIMHIFNNYKQAVSFLPLYQQLTNKFPNSKQIGMNNVLLGMYVDPWRLSADATLETLVKGYQLAAEEGDLNYCNYANLAIMGTALWIGKPFSEIKKYFDMYSSFNKKTNLKNLNHALQLYYLCFQWLSTEKVTKETVTRLERSAKATNNKTELGMFYAISTKFFYIFGDIAEAQRTGLLHFTQVDHVIGLLLNMEGQFYFALALFSTSNDINQFTSENKKILKKIHKRLQYWNSGNSENFQHYLLLFEAEYARIMQLTLKTIALYQQVLLIANEKNILPFIGITNECISRFYLTLGLSETAKLHHLKAHYAYKTWGAITKCRFLEKEHLDWFQTPVMITTPVGANPVASDSLVGSIDILSILKSAQAISSELSLDKLLHQLLYIVLQSAGAQRGLFLVQDEGGWYVEAEGTMDEQRITLTKTERIEQRTDLPLSIINFVQRTQDYFLVQDINALEPSLALDMYLEKVKPQSILALPIMYQNKLRYIVYLENRDTNCAFTPIHIQTLQLIASQAAISIENSRLYYKATHDPLTGLANRNLLYQMFTYAAYKAKRDNHLLAIIFLDLDGFKQINDMLGHDVGDKLLIYFAERIQSYTSETDITTRLGGDEFVLMLEDIADPLQAGQIATRILEEFAQEVTILGHEILINTSIGISIYPENGEDIQTLLKQADIALYRVKAAGKGHYQFYTANLNDKLQHEITQELELRKALEEKQLCIYYQPVYQGKNCQLSHVEALLRWNHPQHGLMDAQYFISCAEKTGLIVKIGEWIFRTVCAQIKTWQDSGIKIIPIAMNISGVQFKKQVISVILKELLQEMQINPEYIELEFTESVFIDDTDKIKADIAAISMMNIKLTIDDFGTYYSGLSYLNRFKFHKIKIDQSFIENIDFEDENNNRLILAIIAMAHSLNLKVIAEGVETKNQLVFLQKHQVDEFQGYYLSHPLSVEDFTIVLQEIPELIS